MPSAAAVPSAAATVEFPALVMFGVKLTLGVCAIATASVSSVAWNVTTLDSVDDTVNVTTPPASDGPDGALIVTLAAPPAITASETSCPTIGLPAALSSVTVTNSVSTPSATALPSAVATVDIPASATLGAKLTFAVCVIATPSESSVAWSVITLDSVELTVNVTTPFAPDGPDGGLMVTFAAPPATMASDTVRPVIGAPATLRTVTVINSVSSPSATAPPSAATTVDVPASVRSGVKTTSTVCVTATPLVSSVAWNVTVLASVELTVNVTTPFAPDGPEGALMVTFAAPPATTARDTS